MIESYLMGMVTGFLLGMAVVIVPEQLRKLRNTDKYIDLR